MKKTEPDKKRKAIVNRMAKVIGHTRSIKCMVENGRDCSEVLIQLAAVKAAVNNTGREILKEYLREAAAQNDQEKLRELSRIIESFMKS